MKINLTHNKIVKETLTDAFCQSVEENLYPKLSSAFGREITELQMYEDYLADNFEDGDYWYYPMSVIFGDSCETVWVRWNISDKSLFKDGIPYSYLGDSLEFELCDREPPFASVIGGRSRAFVGNYVKLNVVASAPSPTVLVGKYSQTFIDEMTRQITAKISKEMRVQGLAESSIEIDMVFAPGIYMEHISDGVTYRRLLISAKGCSPRDFWIKWTSGSSRAVSISETECVGDITFELAEDVSHKIREKEYRFLVSGNSDKYRSAMGRKNITEWRDIIKRAIKRGELVKVDNAKEEERISEVSDKLSEILAKCGITSAPAYEEEIKEQTSPEFERAMAYARSLVGDSARSESELSHEQSELEYTAFSENRDAAPSVEAEVAEGSESEPYFTPFAYVNDMDGAASAADAQENGAECEAHELPEIEETYEEIPEAQAPDDNSGLSDNAIINEWLSGEWQESSQQTEETEEEPFSAVEPSPEIYSGPAAEEETEPSLDAVAEDTSDAEKENDGVSASVANSAALDALISENEALRAERDILLQKIDRIERESRESIEKLTERLEIEAKKAEREKMLFAEAARIAGEEKERLQREREAAEKEALAKEAARLAEEKALREMLAEKEAREREIARIEAEERTRQEELERLRLEAEAERARAEENRQKTERLIADIKAGGASRLQEEKPDPAPVRSLPNYTYTQKLVRLLFRHSVDPNITARIHELITVALSYFDKQDVYMKVKASIPDTSTVVLNFVKIPEEELDLLVDIIKFLGNSDLGIYKIILE